MEQIATYPNHLAIIMDGNRRWARQRGLSDFEGHQAGLNNLRSLLEYLSEVPVKYITVFLFSTENWSRSEEEVSGLFQLFEESLIKELPEFQKRGIRVLHLGQSERLPSSLQQALTRVVSLTRDNSNKILNLAVNYGGRAEILNAIRRIAAEGVPAGKIDEKLIRSYFYNPELPDVDLLVRTSGEFRTSNFLMWQLAYSELYFTNVLWPDFNTNELKKALQAYSQRLRRFGGD